MFSIDLTQMSYEGGKYFLAPYYYYDSNHRHPYTLLILDFKENQDRALKQFRRAVSQAFLHLEDELLEEASSWYLIALPPHEAGQRNDPCEDLCTMLAEQFSWLTFLPGALARVTTIVKSATASKCGLPRPTIEDHRQSIRYRGPVLQRAQHGVLLVDDVYTNGNTYSSCYAIIKKETGIEHINGFFLGKTVK